MLAAENVRNLTQQFDFIYGRFILMHVKEPQKVLENLYQCLTEKGVLAFEEPTMSSCYALPRSDAFQKSIQILMDCARKLELDFDIGDRLLEMFRNLGCTDAQIHLTQQIVTKQPDKRFMELLLREAAPKYIANGVTTQDEIDRLASEMQQHADAVDSCVVSCRQTQVWATR